MTSKTFERGEPGASALGLLIPPRMRPVNLILPLWKKRGFLLDLLNLELVQWLQG